MSRTPKVTVIIPTRERADVFRYALRTVVAQDYDNLDIIVSDNFSQDETAEICRASGDSRIRYLNTGRRISMSDNWDFALGHVSEGWVTIIGDDDGLLPGAVVRIAAVAAMPGIEAFRAVPCTYSWPQVVNGVYGRLNVPTTSGEEIRDSSAWLEGVLEGRASCAELPMLYNGGTVDVEVMKRIKGKTGRFFSSCVPDVYSAVAIACTTPRYLFSFEPFAINGASAHSNGRSAGQGGLRVKGTPADKWASEANLPIHPTLRADDAQELVPAVQFWVYEAYLQSAALRTAPDSVRLPDQMALILAAAGSLRPVMQEWASKLANLRGYDIVAIGREADRLSSGFAARAWRSRFAQVADTYFAGSQGNPIVDVVEASRIAGAVRADPPGRLSNLASFLGRAMLRFR